MLLPIGDDNPKEKIPYVHYGIMAVNAVVFVFMATQGRYVEAFYLKWGLVPAHFTPIKLLTSMYLHGGLGHVFLNLLFLWVVGDNVEDRIGHVGYLVFYHVAGVAAGLTHAAFTSSPQIPLVGASGAISGVMGAYAVFFPHAKIKIWYWVFLFWMGVAYVSAKWVVGLWFLQQLLLWLAFREGGVAYGAHVGGLLFGVVTAGLLRLTFLREYDTVRRVVRGGRAGIRARRYAAEGQAWGESAREQPVVSTAAELETQTAANIGIVTSLQRTDLQTAYRYFARATGGTQAEPLAPETVMRLGEALLSSGNYGGAARVYEVMLERFGESADAAEAAFRLGTIQSRALKDYSSARTWLTRALHTHPDPRRRRTAADELKRIDAELRRVISFRRRP